jgi:hypothetical protein
MFLFNILLSFPTDILNHILWRQQQGAKTTLKHIKMMFMKIQSDNCTDGILSLNIQTFQRQRKKFLVDSLFNIVFCEYISKKNCSFIGSISQCQS